MPREVDDLAICRRVLAIGSRSFAVASLLLPRRLRGPVAAVYAFLRVADDLVDEGDPEQGLADLFSRVDAIYAGRPADDAIDRAFAAVVWRFGIPRAAIEALLEGFAWDARARAYDSLEDVLAYAVRVASSVGVVMAWLMDRRDTASLARACDLGIAMQLTNIARDVGEDAARGRIYLPRAWMRAHGVDPEAWRREPRATATIRTLTVRVLDEADRFYARAAPAIAALPRDCRWAVAAAASIYRDIGRVIRSRAGDAVSARAHVSGLRKLWWVLRTLVRRDPGRAWIDDPPAPAAVDLVGAMTHGSGSAGAWA